MFISNSESISNEKIYRCNRVVGNYLVKSGIPLLSRDGKYMLFTNNTRLQSVLKCMPIYLKIFSKKEGDK